jgi:hypothetical protein
MCKSHKLYKSLILTWTRNRLIICMMETWFLLWTYNFFGEKDLAGDPICNFSGSELSAITKLHGLT